MTRPDVLLAVDLEPAPPSAPLEFAGDLPPALAEAFRAGVNELLDGWSWGGTPPYALRRRLRAARWEPGPDTEGAFTAAGRWIAREISHCVDGGASPHRLLPHWPSPDPSAVLPPRPARPVHGVHIRVCHPGACGMFADTTADFDPAPAEHAGSPAAFTFTCDFPVADLWERELVAAWERGVLDALCGGDDRSVPAVAFHVTLRSALFHPVDASELAFRAAGERSVREVLRRLAEED